MNLVDITVHATGTQAKAAIDEVKGKLDDLGKRVADARIRLSGNVEAQAQLARINARMIELNNRIADPKIKIEGIARAQAELLALLAAMNKLDNTSTKRFSFGQGATGFFGAIQKGLAAILNMGPAAVPVLAGIAAAILVIVSALGAMVSAIAAAGIGLGAFAVFAVPTFMKIAGGIQAVNTAMSKLSTDKLVKGITSAQLAADRLAQSKAWAAIPVALQPAVRAGLALKDTFDKMVAAMQPQVVKIFGDALKVVRDLLPQLMPIARTAGNAIDGLLKGFDRFAKGQGFKSFLASMQQLAGPAITAIGQGLGQVAIALGQFLQTAASPDGIIALKGALWLLAGAIKLVTIGVRVGQTERHAFLGAVLAAAGAALGGAKRIADAFLTMVSTIARIAAKIPGPWQDSMKKLQAAADRAKRGVDVSLLGIQGAMAATKRRLDAMQPIFKLQGNIIDLQNKLATANRELGNPNLTKTRKAQIEANIDRLLAAIARAKASLASIQNRTVYINYATSGSSSGTHYGHPLAAAAAPLAAAGVTGGWSSPAAVPVAAQGGQQR